MPFRAKNSGFRMNLHPKSVFPDFKGLLTNSQDIRQTLIQWGWQMIKAPPYSLDLHILVFQNRPDRGAFMFENMFEKVLK